MVPLPLPCNALQRWLHTHMYRSMRARPACLPVAAQVRCTVRGMWTDSGRLQEEVVATVTDSICRLAGDASLLQARHLQPGSQAAQHHLHRTHHHLHRTHHWPAPALAC